MSDGKDRTIFENWKRTGELATFILNQEGLTHLDDWGGKETVREILPEDYQANFDLVQTDLVNTILKEKNRGSASAFIKNILDYANWVMDKLDGGRPACYHYFPISVEIMLALDLVPICYEVLCGLTSALYTDGAEEGVDRIEADGYPDHLCSTQKGTAGFLLLGLVPRPDILVKTATPCDASNRLYEWTAHRFKTPLLTIETPYYRNERGLKFMIRELKRTIAELEKLSGRTLDLDRLREFCRHGNEAMEYILKVQELKKLIPCPDTGWHRPADTIFMTQIGTPMGAAYFKQLYADVKSRADRNQGVIPPEMKERRVVYGYTWECYDLPLFDWLEDTFGVTYMADTLTYFPPDVGFVDTTNLETMLEGLAWRILQMPMGRQTMGFSDVWINDFVTIVQAFRADALILGGHMACKHFWALNKLLSDKIKAETGVPSLRFEMDMFDKRFTPPTELRRIMTEFFTTR
ncbi:MAG: 2-hydroxyacyl-CoA dehydratase family protein [Thermodesulfobacteriota bacterium]